MERVTLGGAPAQDTVLLSSAQPGSPQLDPGVDWTEQQAQPGGLWRSTPSPWPNLASALTGYRRAAAPGTLRSTITVVP